MKGRKALSEEIIRTVKDIAVKEFTVRGYEAASTNAIIQSVAISKGSLFNHFGSKKELYFLLVREKNGDLVKALQERTEEMPADFSDLAGRAKAPSRIS